MICPTRTSPRSPDSERFVAHPGPPGGPARRDSPYGAAFWLSFLANMLVTVAIALLFRYADFVTLLGGDELHLGWIVGVGMLGSLTIRLILGTGIDRYGPRLVWLGSVAVFVLSCFAHLWITSCHTAAIYLLRIGFCSSIAGVFMASICFVSARAPTIRIAEMIGMLGTGAFVGIILGTQLGDYLLGTDSIQRPQIERMFLVAGSLGSCAMLFAWLATRGQARPLRQHHPPLITLLRRYNRGTILLVTVAAGAAVGLPSAFLRTFASDLEIPRIAVFFTAWGVTLIGTRICTRRLPERLGLEPMILFGLVGLAVSQLLFLLVHTDWQLVIPGIGYGMSHAVLMPATLAASIRRFPDCYRGLGTSLVLATSDLGLLVGAPVAGSIVHYCQLVGLPGYSILFVSEAGLLGLVAVFYAFTCRQDALPATEIPQQLRPETMPHPLSHEQDLPDRGSARGGRDCLRQPPPGGLSDHENPFVTSRLFGSVTRK